MSKTAKPAVPLEQRDLRKLSIGQIEERFFQSLQFSLSRYSLEVKNVAFEQDVNGAERMTIAVQITRR